MKSQLHFFLGAQKGKDIELIVIDNVPIPSIPPISCLMLMLGSKLTIWLIVDSNELFLVAVRQVVKKLFRRNRKLCGRCPHFFRRTE